ncbi:hypothetical protein [Streptomyces profundus]|uniref:hypothetical protein n=1 Tax=Streptomyces profundus TaxID=2867410 RepID=UPI001D15F676|nr:hypothetical protein [Streptomyces sp. MA3_2.13]UED85854.1 hypothetical protein K4G22_18020 [Streptomyces sp. MA3_2.13]
MNDGSGVPHISAAYDSTVGIQAETVHNSNVYFVHPDASPQEKYKVGVRFLEDGVSSRARDMISDAIAHGYDNAEVRFHWVLAMLSARAYHDLSTEEVQRLHHASGLVRTYAEGGWKDALQVAFELLAMLGTAVGETGRVSERLQALSPRRRDAIVHHLDLVLTGGLKDSLWAENRERAEAARFENDRVNRVWAYFEPEPIGPRAMPPRPGTATADQASLPLRASAFVIATAFLWALALAADPSAAFIELLVGIAAGLTAAQFGPQWWHQEQQRKARLREPHTPQMQDAASTGGGFTHRVRHSFDHYFSVHTPHGFTAQEWRDHTIHMRNDLATEIALLYRESRISVDRVNWLIRYLAEDARDRHNKGTLFDDHYQNQTPLVAKALCVVALVTLGGATLALLGTAASGAGSSQMPLAFLALVGAVLSGRAAVASWLLAQGEEHRMARETQEYKEQLTARQIAYQKWRSFLDAMRPSELQMETWLTCDKTLFVDEALRHYQLTWHDLITHTILMTPARPYKRGRVKGGPWRYSRYSFRLFLVTQDGVREISTELNFTDAKRGNEQQRSNYRFDALSSVQVTESSRVGYDLELILTNGPARSIRVKDADTHQLAPDESAQELADISLNASGFIHAFRLLEGIAADGKGWIERNNPKNLPSFRTAD